MKATLVIAGLLVILTVSLSLQAYGATVQQTPEGLRWCALMGSSANDTIKGGPN